MISVERQGPRKNEVSFQEVFSSAGTIVNQIRCDGVERTLQNEEILKKLSVFCHPIPDTDEETSVASMVAKLMHDNERIESLSALKDLPTKIRGDLLWGYAKRGSERLHKEMLKHPLYLAMLKDGLSIAYGIGRASPSVTVLAMMAEDESIRAIQNDDGTNVDFILKGKLSRKYFTAPIRQDAVDKAKTLRDLANSARK